MARGSFEDYVARIRERQPFAFSRWGDGEWSCLLGHPGQNCDGHRYTPTLRRDLAAVLLDRPTYDLGLQGFAQRRFGPAIETWLTQRSLSFAWVDADVFTRPSLAGTLEPLLEALSRRVVILVGPQHLDALTLFPFTAHVIVPDKNCHEACDRVEREILVALAEAGAEPVIAFSAGMSANVLIHRLHTRDHDATAIDFGSLWEPYVGHVTRSYHQRILDRARCS